MEVRTRSSLLWGLVGVLSFLVLVQGYELTAEQTVGFALKLAIAVVVGAVAAGMTYYAEGWYVRQLAGEQ